MTKDIRISPNEGAPVHTFVGNGEGEVVLDFGDDSRSNSLPPIFTNALVMHSYDQHEMPRGDVRFANWLIDQAIYEQGESRVVLPRQGAVALRGALEDFAGTYGDQMANGVTSEDFQAIIEQLPVK